jgi:hypothetical protein
MTFLTAENLNVALAGRTVLKKVSLSLSLGHLVAPAKRHCCARWPASFHPRA